MSLPFYIVHYTKNADRRAYIKRYFAASGIEPEFVTLADREDLPAGAYTYDERLLREMLEPIKDIIIGYAVGEQRLKDWPFAKCVEASRVTSPGLEEDLRRCMALRPMHLNPAEVSCFLKHREAWRRVAEGGQPYAIVAEDDIIVGERTFELLGELLKHLPAGFDIVDLAGGVGLEPRAGNERVNEVFYKIEPPRDRTACCIVLSRSFAARAIEANPPVCLALDWTLTWLFKKLAAQVYWLHPPIFGHGSEMGIYRSSLTP